MFELRWHGRGGQGAVTAAEMLASAGVYDGWYVQAFPSFGPERRGAPVMAFNRFDKSRIEVVSYIYEPDAVAVLDPKLLYVINVTKGLKDYGILVLNATKDVNEDLRKKFKVFKVDAYSIIKELSIPVVNTTMVGAVAKAIGLVTLESVKKAVAERFGEVNAKAAELGFNNVKEVS